MAMKCFAFLMAILPGVLSAEELAVPHVFESGSPAVAAEVNENFRYLADSLTDTRRRLAEVETRIESSEATIASQTAELTLLLEQLPIVLGPEDLPVVIDQPGNYVLDQDIQMVLGQLEVLIDIVADNVVLDMQGKTVSTGAGEGMRIRGHSVEVRNGKMNAPLIVDESASGVRIENMDIYAIEGIGAWLNGGTTVIDSLSAGFVGILVSGGQHRFVNVWASGSEAAGLAARNSIVEIVDSEIVCFRPSACLDLESSNSIVSNNVIGSTTSLGMQIGGDSNIVKGNTFTGGADTAIEVRGTDNLILDNSSKPSSPAPGVLIPGTYGIHFFTDGNYFGGNLMSAEEPFALRDTTQIDLGGNQGFLVDGNQ